MGLILNAFPDRIRWEERQGANSGERPIEVRRSTRSRTSRKYLKQVQERNFFLDIYQNCSSGYSATILLVATKTPLPAAPSDDTPAPQLASLLRANASRF